MAFALAKPVITIEKKFEDIVELEIGAIYLTEMTGFTLQMLVYLGLPKARIMQT